MLIGTAGGTQPDAPTEKLVFGETLDDAALAP
jgi:hypothetical protein